MTILKESKKNLLTTNPLKGLTMIINKDVIKPTAATALCLKAVTGSDDVSIKLRNTFELRDYALANTSADEQKIITDFCHGAKGINAMIKAPILALDGVKRHETEFKRVEAQTLNYMFLLDANRYSDRLVEITIDIQKAHDVSAPELAPHKFNEAQILEKADAKQKSYLATSRGDDLMAGVMKNIKNYFAAIKQDLAISVDANKHRFILAKPIKRPSKKTTPKLLEKEINPMKNAALAVIVLAYASEKTLADEKTAIYGALVEQINKIKSGAKSATVKETKIAECRMGIIELVDDATKIIVNAAHAQIGALGKPAPSADDANAEPTDTKH